MKTLILAIALCSLPATAATNLTCTSTGTGGDLKIALTAQSGLDRVGAPLGIQADGILHTHFDAVVDKVVECSDQELVIDVTTLVGGAVTPDSGQATITLSRQGGTGKIELTKFPKVKPPLRLMKTYELTDCQGSI
jgi:hypothetical protein